MGITRTASIMIRPLVLSGPSGSGKSTILKQLMEKHQNKFAFSISHTTRSPRPGEEDGKDYYFTNRENIKKLINDDKFLEHAEFAGNIYGTSFEAVENIKKLGKICVLDVDMAGVKSIKNSTLNARFVFIRPPSYEILEERLRSRGTETEDKIKARLARSKADIEFADTSGVYDKIIINDNLEDACRDLELYLKDDLNLS